MFSRIMDQKVSVIAMLPLVGREGLGIKLTQEQDHKTQVAIKAEIFI